MKKILTITGSPVKDSSTEIILEKLADSITNNLSEQIENKIVCLNDLSILPCQACGKSPEPDYCFYKDDIYPLYDYLINCDIVLFGSPVYFDTVSAQAKLFIDRCNCLRPPNFEPETDKQFNRIISKQRIGAIVLSGGERGQFECARKVIAGFFKWVGVTNIGTVSYSSQAWQTAGPVKNNKATLDEATQLGRKVSSSLP